MRTYRILDEAALPNRCIGFLLYYEKSRAFAVELAEDVGELDVPVFLASFLRRGIRSVDLEWSLRWVRQRIIPTDRQNLGMILREHKLKEYDEMKMLLLGHGRCAQDDCAIEETKPGQFPDWMRIRLQQKLRRVAALQDGTVLVAFVDEKEAAQRIDPAPIIEEDQRLHRLKREPELFRHIRLQPGGQGVCWSEDLFIPVWKLRAAAGMMSAEKDQKNRGNVRQPKFAGGEPAIASARLLTDEDLRALLQSQVMDTAAVCDLLHCSRQYVDRLVREGALPTIQGAGKTRLYDRSDVERLTW